MPSRSLPLFGLRRPSVLLCCLLSVAAPFSESALLEVIDGRPAQPAFAPRVADAEEAIDDEEELMRAAGPADGRRAERKHARPLALLPFVAAPAAWIDPTVRANPSPCRSGSEHAFRNGFGSPLLC